MKKQFFFSFLLALVVLGTACKKFEEPQYSTPKFELPSDAVLHNMAELQLKAPANGYGKIDTNDFFVSGVVVSSDEGNNFYKEMVIQDNIYGIRLQVNRTGLYSEFPIGQRVFINCKNLFIEKDDDIYKVGVIYRDAIGQISAYELKNHLFRDGLPSEENFNVVNVLGKAHFADFNLSKVVRLENVMFDAASFGKPLADANFTTNHTLLSVNGNDISPVYDEYNKLTFAVVLRTSNYADFRAMSVPDSLCTITGILSKYKDTYQIELRTKEDIQF